MENNNEVVKKKKKSPIPLIISLVVVVVLLCTLAFAISGTEGTDLASKFENFVAKITGQEPEEEEEPGANGEDVVVVDEETLREMLERQGTLSIVLTKDVSVGDTLVVNGNKTLSGTKSIIKRLDCPEKAPVLAVAEGSKLTLNGVTVDANGAANGIEVKVNADLKVVSGKVIYGMPYGIITNGTVEIDDILVDNSLHTGIYADNGGKVYMNGGKITHSVAAGIATATTGYAKITGGELRYSDTWLAYNFGTMDITGGRLGDSGKDANIIQNKGVLNIVSATDDYVELFNAGRSGISSVNSTTLNIDGLYVHDVVSQGMNAEGNSVANIKNCIVENTGTRGFYFKTAEVTMDNITIIKSGKNPAIDIETDVVAEVSNIKISDGGHRGIFVNNGKATIKNVEIKNMGGAGIVTAGKNALVTADNVNIDTVEKSGLGITGGSLDIKNSKVKNAVGDGVNISKDAKITLNNVDVINAGKHTLGNYGGTVTATKLSLNGANNGGIVSQGGTVKCDNVTIQNTKSRAISVTKESKITITNLTVPNAGRAGLYASESTVDISNFTISNIADPEQKDKACVIADKSSKVTLTNGQVNATWLGLKVVSKAETVIDNVKVIRMVPKDVTLGLADIGANSKLTMNGANSVFDGNGYTGRGVKVSGTFVFNEGKIHNNLLEGYNGVGVYIVKGGTFIMNGGAVENNKGAYLTSRKDFGDGGAIHIEADSTFKLNGGTIQNNQVTTPNSQGAAGGAICVRGTFDMTGGTIQNNSARIGGAIIVRATGKATISGGTIANNTATGTGGGALYIQGTGTTIKGGNIQSNETPGQGDGVYLHADAALTMTGGTISKHGTEDARVGQGAGVFVAKGATFTMSGKASIEDNHANKAGAGVASAGTFNLNGGTIKNNTTTGNAAGVLITVDGELNMTGGTVSGNVAGKGGSGSGGGIMIQNTATISGGTIKDNIATTKGDNTSGWGSGVFVAANTSTGYAGNLTMTGGKISSHGDDGSIVGQGAGVYVQAGATFIMNGNALIEDNHHSDTRAGAGVAVAGEFYLQGGTIQGNTTGGNAAGVLVTNADGSKFEMTGGLVTGNEANNGAGVFSQSANTTIKGGNIEKNTATTGGGGVAVWAGTLTIEEAVKIQSNTAKNGGGVYVNTSGILTMKGGIIKSNTVEGGNGGGIYIATTVADTKNEISGGTITENNAGTYKANNGSTIGTGYGSGVYVNAGTLEMTGGTISNHGKDKSVGQGAGVYVRSGATFIMDGEDVLIAGNNSGSVAGAGVASGGRFELKNGTIQGNKTTGNAGGILVASTGSFMMSGGTVKENVSEGSAGGGGIMIQTTDASISGGNIKNNSAVNGGGIRVHDGSNVTITGGIFEGNTATKDGGGIYLNTNQIVNIGGDKLVIQNNTAGENGGGICVAASNDVNLTKGLITGNKAVNGGGIGTTGTGRITMSGGTIQANTATGKGSAVCVTATKSSASSKPFTMSGGTISGHGTADERSAALGTVYVAENSIFNMTGESAVIEKNFSTQNGAGVYVVGTFEMTKGTIQDNDTSKNGGGVYVGSTGTFTMNGTMENVENNVAKDAGNILTNAAAIGGGIYQEGNVTINAGMVSGNTASSTSGGIHILANKAITIKDGKVVNNKANGGNGGGIFAAGSNKVYLTGAGEISGNTASGTVQGLFVQTAGTGSQVTLNAAFTIGASNEIRYNGLVARDDNNPVLIIVGESEFASNPLNLGFAGSGTVYIRCVHEGDSLNKELAAIVNSVITQKRADYGQSGAKNGGTWGTSGKIYNIADQTDGLLKVTIQ